MINKIIASTLLISCLFAISLSLMGVSGAVQLAPQFRVFLATCSRELESYKIEIPNIPTIPTMDFLGLDGEWYTVLLSLVLNFVQLWVRFINGLVNLLNFIIFIVNYLIKFIEFFIIILKNFIRYRDAIVALA